MSFGSSPLTLSLALSLYSLINYISILFVWNEVHASLYHTSFTCFKIKGALFHSNRNGLWERWLVSQEWCFAGVLFLLLGESYSFWLSKTVLGMPYSPRHLGTITKISEEKNNSKSRWDFDAIFESIFLEFSTNVWRIKRHGDIPLSLGDNWQKSRQWYKG